jgi:hypothetical protein
MVNPAPPEEEDDDDDDEDVNLLEELKDINKNSE